MRRTVDDDNEPFFKKRSQNEATHKQLVLWVVL